MSFDLATTCGGCCVKGCSIPYETLQFEWFAGGGALIESGTLYKARVLYDENLTEEVHSDAGYGILHTGASYYETIDGDDYNQCIWANLPSTTAYPDEVFHLLIDFPPGPATGSMEYGFNWDSFGGFDKWYGPWGPSEGGSTDEHFIKGRYTSVPPEFFDDTIDDWIIIS